MKIILIEADYDEYPIDCAIHIKPYKVNFRTFQTLKLRTDFDIDAGRWSDVLSSECVWEYTWELNDFHFGVTCEESSEFKDEVTTSKYSRVPYYKGWYSEWSERYGFNIVWKPYESDVDLSIDLYTTSHLWYTQNNY